jgi:hypothetical protein
VADIDVLQLRVICQPDAMEFIVIQIDLPDAGNNIALEFFDCVMGEIKLLKGDEVHMREGLEFVLV